MQSSDKGKQWVCFNSSHESHMMNEQEVINEIALLKYNLVMCV